MNNRDKLFWLGIMFGGLAMIASMGFALVNGVVDTHNQGYIALGDGGILVVEEQSEIKMLSEEGSETCLTPVGSYTPVLCTEEYMGKFFIAQGELGSGEYLVQGKTAYIYLPDSSIPTTPGMIAGLLIAVSLIALLYFSLMIVLYFRLR